MLKVQTFLNIGVTALNKSFRLFLHTKFYCYWLLIRLKPIVWRTYFKFGYFFLFLPILKSLQKLTERYQDEPLLQRVGEIWP